MFGDYVPHATPWFLADIIFWWQLKQKSSNEKVLQVVCVYIFANNNIVIIIKVCNGYACVVCLATVTLQKPLARVVSLGIEYF